MLFPVLNIVKLILAFMTCAFMTLAVIKGSNSFLGIGISFLGFGCFFDAYFSFLKNSKPFGHLTILVDLIIGFAFFLTGLYVYGR